MILERMMARGWLTHLATNGAGTIHDWEYAWFGASTEGVEQNVADGTFGTWHETSTNIHLALMAGALDGLGYGRIPRPIHRSKTARPCRPPIRPSACDRRRPPAPPHRRAGRPAAGDDRAKLARRPGRRRSPLEVRVDPRASLPARRPDDGPPGDRLRHHRQPPGLQRRGDRPGGRARISRIFGGSLEDLDGGVVLSVGSAIMGPQVFEKALSCVNNLRIQEGRAVVRDHAIYVVDLQDGGGWDWTAGSPPRRIRPITCDSARAIPGWAARLNYLQADNVTFIHHLHRGLVPA